MRNLPAPVKGFTSLIFAYLFIAYSVSFAQDETWFSNITDNAGLTGLPTDKIQICDINGDNYPDILVGTAGLTAGNSSTFSLFLNVPNPDSNSGLKRVFVDFTDESGINKNRDPEKDYREFDVAVLADIDNDGDRDLVTFFYYHRLEWFQPGHSDRPEVYLNDGTGKFTLKEDSGINDIQYYSTLPNGLIDAVGMSYLDYDYDGILDVYVATKFVDYRYGVNFPDVLLKGNGDGSYTYIKNNGVQAVAEPLYGVNVTDWNNDGWQDVLTSPYCRTGGRLLKNMKNGNFTDAQNEAHYTSQKYGGDWYQSDGVWVQKPLCQWEAPTADFDNDGDIDVLQCLIHGGYEERDGKPEGHTHIAVNTGYPDYRLEWDMSLIHRNAPAYAHLGDYGGLFIDMDNDGWQDICIAEGYYTPQSRRLYACIQRDDNEFYDVTADLGLSWVVDASEAVGADFDLDGDEDLFVCHNDPTEGLRMVLLENKIGNEKNWTSVKLTNVPEGCNRDAMGARITTYAGGIAQIREIQAGEGHFGGQKPFIRNFGIDKTNGIDSIKVRWPNADIDVTTIENPPINVVINIDKDGYDGYIKTWEGDKPVVKYNVSVTRFDTVYTGNSKDMTFSIINVGDAPMNITSMSIGDNPDEVFSIGDIAMPQIINPGEKLDYQVNFAPIKRQDYFGTIKFTTDAVNAPVSYHDIWGYGYSPKPFMILSNDTLKYVDGMKDELQTKTLTIENKGEEALEISTITVVNDLNEVFSLDKEYNNITIDAFSSKEITVEFLPAGKWEFTGRLTINSNAFNGAEQIVYLNGISDGPIGILNIDKPFLSFTKTEIGDYKEKEFAIVNEGEQAVFVENIYLDGDYDEIFTFPGAGFPFVLEPSVEKTITLRFTPAEDKKYEYDMCVRSDAYMDTTSCIIVKATGIPTDVEELAEFDNNISIEIVPNPFSAKAEAVCTNKYDKNLEAEIFIVDASGRRVFDVFRGIVIPGESRYKFKAKNLPAGAYYLIFTHENNILQKLMINIK